MRISAFYKVLALFLLFQVSDVSAQCPMCKASLESNIKSKTEEKKIGSGINKGILYLLAMPFLAAGSITGAYFYNKKRS